MGPGTGRVSVPYEDKGGIIGVSVNYMYFEACEIHVTQWVRVGLPPVPQPRPISPIGPGRHLS